MEILIRNQSKSLDLIFIQLWIDCFTAFIQTLSLPTKSSVAVIFIANSTPPPSGWIFFPGDMKNQMCLLSFCPTNLVMKHKQLEAYPFFATQ